MLTDIFNTPLSQAVLPVCLKMSTIVPVPKNSAVESIDNYHLVALTPVVMRYSEQLVLTHIKDTVDTNLDPHRYADRKNLYVSG